MIDLEKIRVDPELMGKISSTSRMYVQSFYTNHRLADEKLGRCEYEGITHFVNAKQDTADAKHQLIKDAKSRRISDKEVNTILNTMYDFHYAKDKKFKNALEKCGCELK